MVTSSFNRALMLALPVSLFMWSAMAVAAVHVTDIYRPGFKYSLKTKLAKVAVMIVPLRD